MMHHEGLVYPDAQELILYREIGRNSDTPRTVEQWNIGIRRAMTHWQHELETGFAEASAFVKMFERMLITDAQNSNASC